MSRSSPSGVMETSRPASGPASALGLVGVLLAAGACTGTIEGGGAARGPDGRSPISPGTPGTPGGSTGGSSPTAPTGPVGSHPLEPRRDSAACREINPGPAPIRRLTRFEYDRTV